jgi:hypothetical protein
VGCGVGCWVAGLGVDVGFGPSAQVMGVVVDGLGAVGGGGRVGHRRVGPCELGGQRLGLGSGSASASVFGHVYEVTSMCGLRCRGPVPVRAQLLEHAVILAGQTRCTCCSSASTAWLCASLMVARPHPACFSVSQQPYALSVYVRLAASTALRGPVRF